MSEQVYAIIPARGGSKGLPGKNILSLAGKPLIVYTIEAALSSGIFKEVIVSTDSEEIAEVAMRAGASVPFLRPSHLATDSALAIDVYHFTIAELEKKNGSIDAIAVLQPTSPLRSHQDIINAYKLFVEKNAESVISYVQESHPIAWHKYVNADLSFAEIFNTELKNRQEFKPTFYPNGAIYFFRKEFLMKGKYYGEKSYAYIMPANRSVDIDYMQDFEYAEFLLSKGKSL